MAVANDPRIVSSSLLGSLAAAGRFLVRLENPKDKKSLSAVVGSSGVL
jgi:hypothetical protein